MVCLLASTAACSTDGLKPLPVSETVKARQLPPAVLDMYRMQRSSEGQYRAGSLNVELSIYVTGSGDVFVDSGGGGMAFAESCEALKEFQRDNGWGGAVACLNGTLK